MKKQLFLLLLVLICINAVYSQTKSYPMGIMNRLIHIKYNTELYLIINSKKEATKDSALATYNLIRWKIDGLIYQLSSDMITSNSTQRYKLLNEWSLLQKEDLFPITANKRVKQYVENLISINKDYEKYIIKDGTEYRTLNLTTNVFYLIKDSWTVLKGMQDLKTQKTIAIIDLLDQTRLASPLDILKTIK